MSYKNVAFCVQNIILKPKIVKRFYKRINPYDILICMIRLTYTSHNHVTWIRCQTSQKPSLESQRNCWLVTLIAKLSQSWVFSNSLCAISESQSNQLSRDRTHNCRRRRSHRIAHPKRRQNTPTPYTQTKSRDDRRLRASRWLCVMHRLLSCGMNTCWCCFWLLLLEEETTMYTTSGHSDCARRRSIDGNPEIEHKKKRYLVCWQAYS